MGTRVAVGVSDGFDSIAAYSEACEQVLERLDRPVDLCAIFISAAHISMAPALAALVAERLRPGAMIGCGAGGVLAGGREFEDEPAAVVWAASLPGATATTAVLSGQPGTPPGELTGWPATAPASLAIVLADPYSFASDSLLQLLNSERPGLPVVGGLASAGVQGAACLVRDGEIVGAGAVACLLDGVEASPLVSQGARPLGPEMTITAASDHLISELASKPAMERLGEVVQGLGADERELVAAGMMIGVVIDENRPEHEQGDFLVRPILGADPDSGAIAIGERVRVGQTVRVHVRDAASAGSDLRAALALRAGAFAEHGAAGALAFCCNGRGSAMFGEPGHDAGLFESELGAPAAGFFCAGELGPVGGRNFLHGYTATAAIFGAG